MRPLTPKLKREIDENPYFKVCARRNDDCDGRITIEHAFIYAGRQINEIWALLPLCEYHHSIGKHMEDGELDKRMNQLLCLRRATREDLKKYPNVDWEKLKNNLENYARKTPIPREERGEIQPIRLEAYNIEGTEADQEKDAKNTKTTRKGTRL